MNAEHLLQHFERLSETPDAISRLRRFILDLAVRGKLVGQDPNDESAEELLKRIQAEQARLLKEGKIKEIKALAPITANNAYELPANWKWVPLGLTVNSHLGGGTPSKNNSAYWGGDIYWASVKDIGKGKYVDETIDQITEAGLADSSSNLISPGNLIVVTRMGLGKVSINRVHVAINQDLRALSLSSLSAIDYYYNFLKTHGFEGSGLTVKGIKVEELLNIPFPLPPLAEQHRIVAKVDELMTLCDQLEAAKTEREKSRDQLVAASLHYLNQPADTAEAFRKHVSFTFNHIKRITTRPAHIKQLRQTILNLAVRGKLVPQNPNDEPSSVLLEKIAEEKARLIEKGKINQQKPLPEINEDEKMFDTPSGWSWTRSETVANFIDPHPSHRTPPEYEGGIPYVGYTDIDHVKGINFTNARKIAPKVFEEHLERYQLKVGDFIFGKIGTLGQPFFLSEPFDYCLSANLILIQPNSMVINPKFLAMFLDSPTFINVLVDQTTNSTHGVFGIKKARLISLPLPPFAEQSRIIAKFDELMALCNQLETQLTTTETDSRCLLEAVLHEALAPVLEEETHDQHRRRPNIVANTPYRKSL